MTIKLPFLLAVSIAALCVFYFTTSQGLSAAPSTTITTSDAVLHDLAGGKTRLITFYSPDCAFSKSNVAGLNALQNEFDAQPFDVIAIAMSYDNTAEIEKFIATEQPQYAMAHDSDGSVANAFQNVRFTPTSFLIDESGNIVWKHTGRMPVAKVSAKISTLLNEPKIAQLSQ